MLLKNLVRIGVIGFLLAAIAGCSLLQSGAQLAAKKPAARLTDVRVTSLGLEQINLMLDLEVRNPNAFALTSQGLDLNLAIENQSVLSLNRPDQRINVPARSSSTVSLPLTLRFVDLYRSVSGLRDKDSFDYAIGMALYFNLPILGDVSVPVEWQGELPIPRLPKVSFAAVNLSGLSLTGANLAVTLQFTNSNGFDLNLNHFDYRLSANGLSIADGQLKNLHLPKGRNTELDLPVNLSFSQLGLGLYQAFMSDQSVRIGLSGRLDLIPDLPMWRPGPIELDTSYMFRP